MADRDVSDTGSTRRRRLARAVGLRVAIGAMLAVGMAWACAALAPLTLDRDGPRWFGRAEYEARKPEGWPPWFGSVWPQHGFGVTTFGGFGYLEGDEMAAYDPQFKGDRLPLVVNVYRAGWPMRCVHGYRVGVHARTNEKQGVWVIHGIGDRRMPNRVIPWYPEPLGLLVDVLVFAALVVLVVDVVPAAHRALRRRLQHCPHCRKPIEGRPARCPHCARTLVGASHGRRGARRSLRLAGLLVAGAGATVSIAWAAALGLDPYGRAVRGGGSSNGTDGTIEVLHRSMPGAGVVQLIHRPPREGFPALRSDLTRRMLPGWTGLPTDTAALMTFIDANGVALDHVGPLQYNPAAPLGSFRATTIAMDGRGWPLIALRCSYLPVTDAVVTSTRGGLRLEGGRMRYPQGNVRPRRYDPTFRSIVPPILPWRPVWTGLLVDTIIFAALFGVLLAVPARGRRVWRRLHGCCPECNYPAGERTICTECGAALRR